MELRVLIIDDERKARELLEILLKALPGIELLIVGSVASVSEGISEIKSKRPNLVFLDVEMPEQNGLALFQSKEIEINFEVIFVTAYSHYAVDAFKVNAIDYLLKPISREDLVQAVNRVTERLSKKSIDAPPPLLDQIRRLTESPRIGFPTSSGVHFVEVNQIRRCEASSNYTFVHFLNGEKMIISRTLKDLEDALRPYLFCRIHKSHLVRLNQISSYRRGENSAVTLVDGTVLPVSKPMREGLEENLKIL